MKPRTGDTVECVMEVLGVTGCIPFFHKGETGEVTIVRSYVKGEYIYLSNNSTTIVDSVSLQDFKAHFQIIERLEDA